MRLASCRDYETCDSSCLQDQREWCHRQEAFMDEPDETKRDALIWEFVLSLQRLMRNLTKKLAKKRGRYMDVEDVLCHMNLLLFRRFKKTSDSGTYYKRTKIKGYLNKCIRCETARLRQINGDELSLDELMEKRRHYKETTNYA